MLFLTRMENKNIHQLNSSSINTLSGNYRKNDKLQLIPILSHVFHVVSLLDYLLKCVQITSAVDKCFLYYI